MTIRILDPLSEVNECNEFYINIPSNGNYYQIPTTKEYIIGLINSGELSNDNVKWFVRKEIFDLVISRKVIIVNNGQRS